MNRMHSQQLSSTFDPSFLTLTTDKNGPMKEVMLVGAGGS